MSCLPPEQMPSDHDGQPVVLYPSFSVGVSTAERGVALMLNHPRGKTHASPALLLSEKDTAQLIFQLQTCLHHLVELPVTPYVPYD